jgi:hypothetical protein
MKGLFAWGATTGLLLISPAGLVLMVPALNSCHGGHRVADILSEKLTVSL